MWTTVKLGELYDVASSKRVLKADWKNFGVPFYRGREITSLSKDGFVNNELFITEEHYQSLEKKYGVPKAGDIMITAIGTIGNTYIVDDDDRFYFKDASVLWLKKKTEVLSKFVQYWLRSTDFFEQLDKGNGATVDTLTIQKLASVSFKLPPLAEQQRIVEKLDRAFAEIDEAVLLTSKNIEDSKRVYEYAIDTIFEKQGERRKRIGEFSSINYGFTASASAIGSYKFLRITDIQNNFVNWDNVPYCDVEEKRVSQFLLQDGDIVFARTGATTGKSFLVKNPLNSVFASYLIRLSVNREMLNPNYVMHFFQSTAYWRQVNEGLTGAAQGGFNASKLGNLIIPILEMNKQQEIVEKLDSIYTHTNELGLLYNRKNVQLNSLKSSILKQALQPPQQ